MKPLTELITIHPDYVSGNTLFKGTRVPVKILFDYLKNGHSLQEFLEQYPGVSEEQAVGILDWVSHFLTFKPEPTYEEAAALRRKHADL